MPNKKIKNIINFAGVNVIRSNQEILKNITVNINSGENVIVFGPNGSGKSTFLRLITRQIYPSYVDNNTVCRVCGKTVWDIKKLRNIMGIVSADMQYDFNYGISGFEVVLSGFFSSVGLFTNHKVTTTMLKKTEQITDFLEISHLKNKYMNIMSAGEAKKFLIARALVNDPQILILDEPSNNLDVAASKKFKNILQKIIKHKTNVICITHHVSDIIPQMSRIIMFKKGQIVHDGETKNLLNSKNMSSLFDMNINLIKNKEGYFTA